MNAMRNNLAIALIAALTGCAAPAPQLSPEVLAPLACQSKAQCDLFWQRAQAWVAANSAYRVRAANDVLIETYGPFGSKVDMAYRIIRISDSGGGARISIEANCDNFIRCYPTRGDAIASFKSFVKQ